MAYGDLPYGGYTPGGLDYNNPYASSLKPKPATKPLTAWDFNAGNPFGAGRPPQTGTNLNYMQTKPAATGMTSTDLMGGGTQNYVRAPMPGMGSSFEPVTLQDLATVDPFGSRTINTKTGNAYQGGNLMGNVNPVMDNQNISTEVTQGSQGPGSQSPAGPEQFRFTLEDYLNSPGYKWQLEQGTNAVLASAAARGHLGSSGTQKDLMDYAQGLASTYFDKAYNQFNTDRNFTSNRYDTGFNQNMTQKMFDADMWKYMTDKEFDNFWKSDASYNVKMAAKAARDAGLAQVGPDSAGKAIELTTGSAKAIADLGLALASFKAKAATGQGNEDAGMVDAIVGALSEFLGSLKK